MQSSILYCISFGNREQPNKTGRNKLALDGAGPRPPARGDLEGEQLLALHGAGPQPLACAELEGRAAVGARRSRATAAAME